MSGFRLVEKRKPNNLSTLVSCLFLSDEKVTSTKINLSGYFNVADKETEKKTLNWPEIRTTDGGFADTDYFLVLPGMC